MSQDEKRTTNGLLPWKHYVTVTAETLIAFYLATFCMAMYFTHLDTNWLLSGIFMIFLYIIVIALCAKRIMQSFSIAALMLIIPIAPLIALIIVVTLLPIIQHLL